MPLNLTAGVSKKLGLPGYSSVGAICHVELELDSGLLQEDPEAFQAQVRHVYAQCAELVDEELARYQAPCNTPRLNREMPTAEFAAVSGPSKVNGHSVSTEHSGSNGHAVASGHDPLNGHASLNGHDHARGDVNGNGHGHSNGNGHPPSRSNGKARSRMSARQLAYVQDLAGQAGMDAEQIEGFCQGLFEKPLESLSGGEASRLISALQEIREEGQGSDAIDPPEDA